MKACSQRSPLVLEQSQAWLERARRVIPSATQTFSKGPTQFVQGAAPVFLARGQGSHVWDVDGNEYIDYPLALGTIILGYNYPAVTEAVVRQLQEGTIFSLPHPLEVEVAEALVQLIPGAEMVRFAKNGSDATAGAVRAARAYTGRDLIACCGYHGWQDWYIGTTSRNAGVPEVVRGLTLPFQYNDIESLRRIFAEHSSRVAAVIMEPVGTVEPQEGFLQQVRDLTRREGALLIFDEVITGFRFALGGAQQFFGVTPDLSCFGKAMANGFPIAAVVGLREVMQVFDEVFFSLTFGGDALALAATRATIRVMQEANVIEILWARGQQLRDGFNRLAQAHGIGDRTQCLGYPPRTAIAFRDEGGKDSLLLRSLFQQEVIKRGVLSAGYHNICYSLSDDDLRHTLVMYDEVFSILAGAIASGDLGARLEGAPVQPVFRQI